MASNTSIYSVGLRNVGSFQAAGTPWMSGSGNIYPTTGSWVCKFPYVAKKIYIQNIKPKADKYIWVSFKPGRDTIDPSTGLGGDATDVINNGHAIKLYGYETIVLDVKCTEFYASGDGATVNWKVDVFAELTNIPTSSMWELAGSGIDE